MSGRGRQPGQRARGGGDRGDDPDEASFSAVPEPEPFSTFDAFPVLSQAKSVYQWVCGDTRGAQTTWERFKIYGPVASQICSAYELFVGSADAAAQRQADFFNSAVRAAAAVPESLPLAGHVIASVHYCSGSRKKASWVSKKATRSCCVFSAGAAICVAAGPALASSSPAAAAAAAAAGMATGVAADALLVAKPSVPRPLTPGQQFDWAALRLLDALRAVSGFDLVYVFWPEHANELSVWAEHISVGDAARLAVGNPTSAEDASVMSALDNIPSGVEHTFVLWKSNKGHIFASERLHDGRVLVEDLHNGDILPFVNGHAMPMQDLAHAGRQLAGGGAAGHGATAAVASAPASSLAAVKVPAQAAKLISGGKAQLFASRHLADGQGPTLAQYEELARAQSMAGYDLLTANCQHYAQDFWKFTVGHSLGMPNQDFLNLFKIFGMPSKGGRVAEPGIAGNVICAVRQAGPLRTLVDFGMLKLPVVPTQHGQRAASEVNEEARQPEG